MTEILIKRLSDNVSLPKYETDGSSGMDLAANGRVRPAPPAVPAFPGAPVAIGEYGYV